MPEMRKLVLQPILPEALGLAADQYGNYVIQHIIQNGTDKER